MSQQGWHTGVQCLCIAYIGSKVGGMGCLILFLQVRGCNCLLASSSTLHAQPLLCKYRVWLMLPMTTVEVLVTSVRSPRELATNSRKLIDCRYANLSKEHNARARICLLEGLGFESLCRQRVGYLRCKHCRDCLGSARVSVTSTVETVLAVPKFQYPNGD